MNYVTHKKLLTPDNVLNTLDVSEFIVNVMTGINGAHQRFEKGIKKLCNFNFGPTPKNICFTSITSMKLSLASYTMSSLKVKKNRAVELKIKVISDSLGHREKVVLRFFRSWTLTLNSDRSCVVPVRVVESFHEDLRKLLLLFSRLVLLLSMIKQDVNCWRMTANTIHKYFNML